MQKTLAQWHFKPSLAQARQLREQLEIVLREQKVQSADDFLLACAELVVNLSRYPDPIPDNAQLSFSRDQYYWQMELVDDGPSFTDFSRQLACPEPLIAAEGGMGLKLLAATFDEFFYVPACYRQDAQNLMLLRQRIDSTTALPKTLLLVDDDALFRRVISAYMQEDYRILAAENVEQAFDLLMRFKPDLVICDLSIPGSDGPVLYEMIRPIPEVASTAFIYLSGSTDQALIERALSRPIDDFLAKPVTKAQLQAAVTRTLMRRQYLTDQLQRELDQKITLGLHPSLPAQIGQYQCALRTRLPEAGGGDLVIVNESQIIFADLMGHGIGAKGFVYALAGYIRGLCAAGLAMQSQVSDSSADQYKPVQYSSLGCARLLTVISKSFNQDPVLTETLATLLTLQLGEAGVVTLANAGHPQPVLSRRACQRGEKSVQRIQVDGPLPGLAVDEYREQQVSLNYGDRLILFSDGYLDASAPLSNTLIAQIQHSNRMPLNSAADYLLQCTPSGALNKGWSDVDDITLIVLQYGDDPVC